MPDEQIAESSPAPPSESSPEDRFYEDGPVGEAEAETEEVEATSEPEGESEPESEPGSPEPVDERAKRSERDRQRNEQRYQKLLEERYKAQAEADYYKKLAEDAQKPPVEREQQKPEKQPEDSKVPALPREENFNSLREFNEALAKYDRDIREHYASQTREEVRKEFEAQQAKQRESAQLQQKQRYVQERDSRFDDEVKKLSKEASFADIDDALDRVLALPEDQRFGPVLADFMGRYEHGARLAHYLAKNDAERTRITQLSPTDQWKEATELLVRLKPRAEAPRQRKKPEQHPTDLGTSSPGPTKQKNLEDVFYGD